MALTKKDSFILYAGNLEQVGMLTDEQAGRLLKGLMQFALTGNVPQFDDTLLDVVFSFMSAQMRRDAAKYEETCRSRSESGKKGGRPKSSPENQTKPNAFSENQTKANTLPAVSEKAKKADTDTESVTVTETDTVSESESVSVSESEPVSESVSVTEPESVSACESVSVSETLPEAAATDNIDNNTQTTEANVCSDRRTDTPTTAPTVADVLRIAKTKGYSWDQAEAQRFLAYNLDRGRTTGWEYAAILWESRRDPGRKPAPRSQNAPSAREDDELAEYAALSNTFTM